MFQPWKRSLLLGVLACTLTAWGCDRSPTPPAIDALTAEEDADLLLRRLTQTILRPVVPVVRGVGRVTDGVVSQVIATAGGVLQIDGHSLAIPAGAVTQPTLFQVTVLSGDRVEVELRAFDVATGQDVGANGFLIPVRLALSYSEASVSDPSKLVVVRYEADGSKTELPTTVDQSRQVAWTDLPHFTRYGLCER